MKTIKTIAIVTILISVLISCTNSNKQTYTHQVNKLVVVVDTNPIICMNNPAIFAGSDFGNFLKI